MLLQLPRLYDVYKASGIIDNFEQLLDNIFVPLFEVTLDPNSHPQLHLFLKQVHLLSLLPETSTPFLPLPPTPSLLLFSPQNLTPPPCLPAQSTEQHLRVDMGYMNGGSIAQPACNLVVERMLPPAQPSGALLQIPTIAAAP